MLEEARPVVIPCIEGEQAAGIRLCAAYTPTVGSTGRYDAAESPFAVANMLEK